MTAIIFPGQGSQYLNMSMDFNENFDVARRVFQEIEDITQINIRKIIAENPSDKLNQTNYTQISIFSASIAIYKSLLSEFGNEIIKPKIILGHSLGEYSALVASNLINITDASILIILPATKAEYSPRECPKRILGFIFSIPISFKSDL